MAAVRSKNGTVHIRNSVDDIRHGRNVGRTGDTEERKKDIAESAFVIVVGAAMTAAGYILM